MSKYLFIIGILFSLRLPAQTIDSMMNVYSTKYPQEKIHVHFDKTYYNPGETIWFKAYIMSGIFLSDISKNLYIELTDDAGKLIQRKVAPVLGSTAAADFEIPATYSRQSIHFRAYTTWMLNFDTAFLYDKNLHIITSSTAVKNTNATNITSLQFFPEGGDLVTGTESLLAFKANDRFGRPVKVKGIIKNKAGKKIADFTSTHDGMGYISFTPLKEETYTAAWKDATGKDQLTTIPAAQDNGTVMHLTSNEGEVLFTLRKSVADSGLFKKLILMAHMGQQIVYKATINFPASSSVIDGSIPAAELPTGILQVTLFDDEERPLQERIVFVNNNEYLFDAYVNAASKKLTKRGKNVLEVEVTDTALSNLSISITDAGVNVPDENEDNIYSRFLLTSEIRGYVHNPGYYFSSYADSVRRQLDLVMLTNGWRRFKWEDLAQRKEPVITYFPENYLTVRGSVNGIDAAKLPLGTSLNMIMQYKDSSKQFLSAPVDKKGKFVLPALLFYDTAKIFYQFNNDNTLADRVAIYLDNGLRKEQVSVKDPSPVFPLNLPDSIMAKNKRIAEKYIALEADRTQKVKILEEVVVKGTPKTAVEKLNELYTTGMFKSDDGYSFDPANDPFALGATSVFTYLQGKVAGLQINNTNSNAPSLSWRGGAPGLFLNEMQTEAQALSDISMNDVAYIKVFRPPFLGGSGGASGAIAVYTKKGVDVARPANETFKGLNKMNLAGYSPLKEFYSPNYEVPNTSDNLDDLRTTLYWNPFLLLDKDKRKIAVSFYNNDITKQLRVIIEGVNQNGKLTRVEEIIK